MAKEKRVEVLFEPRDYRVLEDVAHREGKSVGSVIREAVAKYITRPTQEQRRRAFEALLSAEPVELPEWEVLKEEMAESEAKEFDKLYETD